MSRRKQEKKHSSNDGITDKNLNCAEPQKRESAAIITYSNKQTMNQEVLQEEFVRK